MKKGLPKILEPDENLVHYQPSRLADLVNLCGLTDFLGNQIGKETTRPVTCPACIDIVDYIHAAHRRPTKKVLD